MVIILWGLFVLKFCCYELVLMQRYSKVELDESDSEW